MFKTPDWDDDVPQTHTSFLKTNVTKKQKSSTTEIQPKVSLKVNKIKGKKSVNKKQSPKVAVLNKSQSPKVTVLNKKQLPKIYKSHKNKKGNIEKIISNNVKENQNVPNTNGVNKTTRKRKLEKEPVKAKNKKKKPSEEVLAKIADTQNFDEILLNVKKKKFNKVIENEDKEELLFSETETEKNISKPTINSKVDILAQRKKEKLKTLISNDSYRRHINVENKSNKLRERMLERLKAAQFRYLNEKLYTSSGSEAQKLFQEDPSAFETYHQGYQLQVKKWPVNPLDVIVKKIMKMPKTHLIADMGCGEAALSKRIPHKVRSFDLVATAPDVEACDMARTPLLTSSVDVAVYCLALMGTDLTQYLVEANRVLKMGGHLLIAEVESRFDKVENFTQEVQRLGFKLKQLDKSNKVFYFMEFTKIRDPPVKKSKLPAITLKPCLYKRR